MKPKHRIQTTKSKRVSGDLLYYFILHNIVSSLLFTIVVVFAGIYEYTQRDVYGYDAFQILLYFGSSEFWNVTFQAIGILLVVCVLGRIATFYGIKIYINYRDKKTGVIRTTKRWGEINRGINRLGIQWFLTTVITAIIYCAGIVSILSYMIFNETFFLPMLIAYSIIKLIVYVFVRWFVGRFL